MYEDLSPVSMAPVRNHTQILSLITGVIDSGDKFITSVKNTGHQFAPVATKLVLNLCPVSTTTMKNMTKISCWSILKSFVCTYVNSWYSNERIGRHWTHRKIRRILWFKAHLGREHIYANIRHWNLSPVSTTMVIKKLEIKCSFRLPVNTKPCNIHLFHPNTLQTK